MNQSLSKEHYDKVLATYANQDVEYNWTSLFLMTKLFGGFASKVAGNLNFNYNTDEEQNVKKYLKTVCAKHNKDS